MIAGAGSGKTRVLTHRVAHLINAVGAKPNEILAITFTNKAAGEMRERLERMLGRTARAIWILTFHAACGRILRREAELLGYKSSFTIYDQADQVRLVKQCLEELDKRPEALHPARDPPPDLERQEPARRARTSTGLRRLVLRPDRRGGLRAVPAPALRLERGRLRRHAHAHRRGARALPRGARALAEGVPLRPRRRVPGHEPRAVPAAPAARRASTRTSSPSAIPTSRSTPSAAPTSATSSSSSATSPARGRSRWSRTTARRTRSSAPRTR